MKLEPLKQWICDTCAEIIATPLDGCVEWLVDEEFRSYDFRICHVGYKPKCFAYDDKAKSGFVPINDMIGSDGVARMLAKLDHGIIHDPEGKHTPRTNDIRGWVDMFRRLQTPYYEEARLYFRKAAEDGFWGEPSEFRPYMEDMLRRVVSEYGDDS